MKAGSQIADLMGEGAYQKSQLITDTDLCDIQIDYIQYFRKSKYWKYINSTVKASALHDYFSQLRGFSTAHAEGADEHAADQPKGEYRADISEFFRDGELVSLRSRYAGRSGGEHGWRGLDSMNFGGSDCGSFTLEDLFALDESQALQIIKRCDEILRLEGFTFGTGEDGTPISLTDEVDGTFITATEMLEHFNFNDQGVVLNFDSVIDSPHVAGEFDVTVPWTAWDYEIEESYDQTHVARFIEMNRGSAH